MIKNVLTICLELTTTVIVVFTCLFTASLGGAGSGSSILSSTNASAEQFSRPSSDQPRDARASRSPRSDHAKKPCKVATNDKKKSVATLLLALGNPQALVVACG